MAVTQTVQIDKALFYDLCARYVPDWRKIYEPKLSDREVSKHLEHKLNAMAARAEYTQNLSDRNKK